MIQVRRGGERRAPVVFARSSKLGGENEELGKKKMPRGINAVRRNG